MELVWNKIYQFLRELRCEDVSWRVCCKTEEYKTASEIKKKKQYQLEKYLERTEDKGRGYIEEYIDSVQECADDECQEAYMQGFLDCLMVLNGAGIIKARKEIEEIIKSFK